jgi:hypothetical protein
MLLLFTGQDLSTPLAAGSTDACAVVIEAPHHLRRNMMEAQQSTSRN